MVLHEALLQLIVAGNCMLYISEDGMKVYHLWQYVLLRDPIGNPLEAVICEELAEDQLPENLRVQVANQDPLMQGGVIDQDPFEKNEQKKHKIYTHIEWSENRVEWYQEYKNKEIDGTGKFQKEHIAMVAITHDAHECEQLRAWIHRDGLYC